MTLWRIVGLTILLVALTFGRADPADDLATCREEVQRMFRERQSDTQRRAFYEVHLSEMLAETRAQLVEMQHQLDVLRQELARRQLPPTKEK